MKPFGYDVDKEFYRTKISGRHNVDIFTDLLPKQYSLNQIIEFGEYKESMFRQKAVEMKCLVPVKGLISLLQEIQRNNLYCGCVTNACKRNADFLLQIIHVKEYFQEVILGDECARAKPYPDPYLEAMRRFRVCPQQCVAFEDSPSGIQAAVAAGIKTIGLTTTQSADVLQRYGATVVVPDFSEVTLSRLQCILNDT
jgi:HAD superfamily hydrolase (TIGR01509 family)